MGKDRSNEGLSIISCRSLINGCFNNAEAKVAIEKELAIFINGKHLTTASLTPTMEKEYVIGYLIGQGFISHHEEIEAIKIEGNMVEVKIADYQKTIQGTRETKYRIVSGGGKAAFFDEIALPKIESNLKISKENIFKAMSLLFTGAELYKETTSVHATGLFTPEAVPICLVEDIGRHNTLDKVIGYAITRNVDLGDTFLASTGRMASEMVSKICRAKIPIVATKTATTKLGIEIGKENGLTIVGFVRDEGTKISTDMEVRIFKERGMKIYTNPERIV